MDSKVEKYYNFIKNDLIDKTIFSAEADEMDHLTTFWIPRKNIYPLYNLVDYGGKPKNKKTPYYVVDFMKSNYGADDADIDILWKWYLWYIYSKMTGINEQ